MNKDMRTMPLYKFERRLQERSFKNRHLLEVMLELTYDCNYSCVHCYIAGACLKKYMTKDEIFKVIDELQKLGCMKVSLTGGEIFLREDIFEIIEHIVSEGMLVFLQSNLSLLTEDKINKLYNLGVSNIDVTILSANKDSFDRLTKSRDYFHRVISNIELLKEKGFKVNLKTCALSQNLNQLKKIENLARKMRVKFLYSQILTPKLDGNKSPLKWRVSVKDYVDIDKRLDNAPMLAKRQSAGEILARFAKDNKRNIIFSRKHLFNCGAGRLFAVISPYGKIRCCVDLPFPDYDVLAGTLKEGWQKTVEFVENAKPSRNWQCKSCLLWNLCDWCPARAFLETDSIEGCPQYFKEAALLRANRLGLFRLKEFRQAVKM